MGSNSSALALVLSLAASFFPRHLNGEAPKVHTDAVFEVKEQ